MLRIDTIINRRPGRPTSVISESYLPQKDPYFHYDSFIPFIDGTFHVAPEGSYRVDLTIPDYLRPLELTGLVEVKPLGNNRFSIMLDGEESSITLTYCNNPLTFTRIINE